MPAAPLSTSEVQAIAPDAAATIAARRLAHPASWGGLGHSDRAVWGECRGSALYQTRVALPGLAAKCSCPSRKVPCKHALGLLFLRAESPENFRECGAGSEPEWVTGWLEHRQASGSRDAAPGTGGTPSSANREAYAKRASRREANVLAGVEQLDLWMADLVRHGLGRLPTEGPELWDSQARRLVDAQAPGLARRVRAIGYRVGVGAAWTERVLGDLGRLALLTEAYRRLDALPTPMQYDVRRWVGFTVDKAEVFAHGESVEDEWVVASATVVEDERLRMRRTWLVGKTSARAALILDVAAGSAPFQQTFVPASAFRARLVFWPSARPERALVAEQLSRTTTGHVPPHPRSIAAALNDYAGAVARDPWLERTLCVLAGVVIDRGAEPIWYAADGGHALRLRGDRHDVLYALGGGHPVCVAGEWNGFVFEPLTVYCEGRAIVLRAEAE